MHRIVINGLPEVACLATVWLYGDLAVRTVLSALSALRRFLSHLRIKHGFLTMRLTVRVSFQNHILRIDPRKSIPDDIKISDVLNECLL